MVGLVFAVRLQTSYATINLVLISATLCFNYLLKSLQVNIPVHFLHRYLERIVVVPERKVAKTSTEDIKTAALVCISIQ